MESKLQRYCDGLLEAGWLASVVVTPLFFNIHSSRVFEPDKLTLLRSIAVLMAAVWLIKFIDRQGWRSMSWTSWRNKDSIWRMPFALPAFLLAIIYLVSTAFSITPIVSWAGSYQRLQGTYTTLSYITIFALMLATIRDRAQVSRVVTTVVVTSIPVALYAMLQHYALDPLPWGGDTQIRVAGSMGNSIFIAAYLIMVVPLTLARIIDAFTNVLNDEEVDAADIIRSAIYIFALACQLIAIFWTNSRGPFIGLAASMYAFLLVLLVTLRNAQSVQRRISGADFGRSFLLVALGTLAPLLLAALVLQGHVSDLASFAVFIGAVGVLVVVILVLALQGKGWRWLWLSWIMLAVTMAGFLALFNVKPASADAYADTPVLGDTVKALSSWRELPAIGRFGNLLESGQGSGRVRVLIWEGTLDLLGLHEPLEWPDGHEDTFQFLRPIIGYGPESMYVAYNRFYPPELATIEARNASPDRAHNETFDALVITGFAGFLAWQFLYLSVFYYGFRWLGVVRSNRDRNVLIGLWIGGALLVGGLFTAVSGPPFVGVAVPFGAIVGLIVYLIYYAIFSRSSGEEEKADPYGTDRLIMIGLVTAILAHYVEIHFGIAIAATRIHFFVYVALMFMVGYFLPRLKATEPVEVVQEKKKSRKVRRATPRARPTGWTGPVLAAAFILALIIGILAFNFTTFSLPPGQAIISIDDVPTAGEIFRQSFFVNAQKGFQDSPFIYLLLVLSWLLGSLLFISEMAKDGIIGLTGAPGNAIDKRVRQGAYVLFALTIVSAGVAIFTFLSRGVEPETMLGRMGFWLVLIYAALCLYTGLGLLNKTTTGRNEAGAVSLVGLIFAFPALIAGGGVWPAIIGIMAGIALYLLWDRSWNILFLPAIIVALVSLFVGLAYVFLHAQFIRSGILPPEGVTETTEATVRRVLETEQTAQLLTFFYVFVFTIIAFVGISLGWEKARHAPQFSTSILSLVPALLLLLLGSFVIHDTNLQVIQADVVYKRADQWDKQAIRDGDPAMWDNAIAIYEHAIELAPREDFYYLWLGRAYLERSGVTADTAERAALLRTAEQRLIEAQRINPLNTDHTANLARLNTRWAEIAAEPERQERINIASDYYEAAMSLSPNNAVIINEYARLAFILGQDCDRALALFERSQERDPYYATTLYEKYEVLRACGDQEETEAEKLHYYELAAETLSDFLGRQSRPAQEWLQLAGLYVVLERFDEAFDAYTMASERRGDDLEQWRIDFTLADMYFQEGQLDKAEEFGLKALEAAPEELLPQLQEFLDNIAAARGEVGG